MADVLQDAAIAKEPSGENKIVTVTADLKNLLTQKFFEKFSTTEQPPKDELGEVTKGEVEAVVSRSLPRLSEDDDQYPEKRDDRSAVLNPGINAFVTRSNEWLQDYKPDQEGGDWDKAAIAYHELPISPASMFKYFVDDFVDTYFKKALEQSS